MHISLNECAGWTGRIYIRHSREGIGEGMEVGRGVGGGCEHEDDGEKREQGGTLCKLRRTYRGLRRMSNSVLLRNFRAGERSSRFEKTQKIFQGRGGM